MTIGPDDGATLTTADDDAAGPGRASPPATDPASSTMSTDSTTTSTDSTDAAGSDGDVIHQRPGIRHYLFDYSEDMEYLEIVSPADFKTVDVEPVCPIPEPTPWK